jgi:hypothetical protein
MHAGAGRQLDRDVDRARLAEQAEAARAGVCSTRVCSASRTSRSRESSVGLTATMVSARSEATIRTSPTDSSTETVIGSGVAKVGMTESPDGG